MLDYLTNYGIKRHTVDYNDIDINDRMMLQDQVNGVRQNYSKLLELADNIQDKILEVSKDISKRTKEIIQESKIQNIKANEMFSTDEDYLSLEIELQALKSGLSMVNNQIEFCKSDLRILNSVFYNKF